MASRASTRLAILVASVAVHALVLWVAGSSAPRVTPLRPRPAELTWMDAAAVPPRVVEPPAPSRPKPSLPARGPSGTRAATPAQPTSPTAGAPGAAASPEGGLASVGSAGDVPVARGVNLTPGLGSVLRMPEAADAEPSRGSTVRNGPGEEIDQVIAKEVEGEVLTRRLNEDLQQELGAAAVAVGSVPGLFRAGEASMREAFKHAPVDVTPKAPGDVARDVARTLLATPGVSPEAARRVTDSPLGRSITAGTVPTPNADDQRFREQAMQMMGAIEALKDKASAPQLRTVLEMTCDPSGAVAQVTVVEKSGDPRFDESVLHLSRKVFRSMPDSDDKGLGSSWWRTRWQFTWEPPSVRVKLLGAHRVTPT